MNQYETRLKDAGIREQGREVLRCDGARRLRLAPGRRLDDGEGHDVQPEGRPAVSTRAKAKVSACCGVPVVKPSKATAPFTSTICPECINMCTPVTPEKYAELQAVRS